MEASVPPRPYLEWRTHRHDRPEDAANSFGYHLIKNCREEALATVAGASDETRAAVAKAVDVALHNVCDMLEGFWVLDAGPDHTIDLVLGIRVLDVDGNVVEVQEISPSKLDLPIGYWKWAEDAEFR